MSIISKAEGARLLGISKQSVQQWKDDEPFFVEVNGKIKIDDTHPAWISKLNSPRQGSKNKKIAKGVQKHEDFKKVKRQTQPETENMDHIPPKKTYDIPEPTEEMNDLIKQAAIAEMQDTIFAAEIKKQKAEQEKLKTLEQKKDLANIDLLIHFFSFAENIIQRWYRRPHELSPQLSALYLAGEEKKAEQLLLKELEGIIKETQKELIKTLEEEGLKISEYN